jgi:hypothetical protein
MVHLDIASAGGGPAIHDDEQLGTTVNSAVVAPLHGPPG